MVTRPGRYGAILEKKQNKKPQKTCNLNFMCLLLVFTETSRFSNFKNILLFFVSILPRQPFDIWN